MYDVELIMEGCPVDYMKPGFSSYIDKGTKMGGFGMAMLAGDLFSSAIRADENNSVEFHRTARWIDMTFPPECYGTQKKVDDWMKKGGLRGRKARS